MGTPTAVMVLVTMVRATEAAQEVQMVFPTVRRIAVQMEIQMEAPTVPQMALLKAVQMVPRMVTAMGAATWNTDNNNGAPCNLNSDCQHFIDVNWVLAYKTAPKIGTVLTKVTFVTVMAFVGAQGMDDGVTTAGGAIVMNEMPGASFFMGLLLLMGLRWQEIHY